MNLSRTDVVWQPTYKIGTKFKIGNDTMEIVSIDYAKGVYIVAKRIKLTEKFIDQVTCPYPLSHYDI